MKIKNIFLILLLLALPLFGQTNLSRIVLGDSNFETDPYPTADLVMQNDGYITNYTNSAITLFENSEDLTFTFAATTITLSSSTGPTILSFGSLSPMGVRWQAVSDGDSTWVDAYTALYMIKAAVGGALKFGVDSTGIIYGSNYETIDNTTNGQWNFGSSIIRASGTATRLYLVADGDSVAFNPYHTLTMFRLNVGGSNKFSVDSTGLITGANSETIDNVTDNIWNLGNSEIKTSGTSAMIYAIADADSVIFDPYHHLQMFRVNVGGTNKFQVDSTGIITGANSETIDNTTDTQWNFGNSVLRTSGTLSKIISIADADSVIFDPGKNLNPFRVSVGGSNVFRVDSSGNVIATGSISSSGAGVKQWVLADADSVVFDPYHNLNMLRINVGGTAKFVVDSAGNATFAGTVNASAFSPTASGNITGTEIYAVSDGDSAYFDPHQGTYAIKLGIGGVKKFSVDSAGTLYAAGVATVKTAYSVADGDTVFADAYQGLYPIKIGIGGAKKFAVDSTGIIYLPNGETIDNATTNGTVSFGAAVLRVFGTGSQVLSVADGDSVWLDPFTGLYPIKVGVGGAKKFAVDSAGIGYFAGDLSVIGGDITGANGNAIDIGEAVDGQFLLSRDDSGNITLTSADDNADANLVVAAGGTGTLTLGDTGSPLALSSNDWTIGTTGAMAGINSIAFDAGDANITAVDTVKSGGNNPRWVLFTCKGVTFAAIAAADTTDIVD